jgi:hypothetical protein
VHGPEVMAFSRWLFGHDTKVCTCCTNFGAERDVQTLVLAGGYIDRKESISQAAAAIELIIADTARPP